MTDLAHNEEACMTGARCACPCRACRIEGGIITNDEDLMVTCATYDAQPGDPCLDNITSRVMDKPHGSRD